MRAFLLVALFTLPAHAGQIIIPGAEPPKPVSVEIAPTLVRPDGGDIHQASPILASDGTPLRDKPAIALAEGSVRLDPARPVLQTSDPEAAPLAEALEKGEPVAGMLPAGPRERAEQAEKPEKSAGAIALEALKEAGAFDGARALKAELAAAEVFAPAKSWSKASRGDIEDKLRAAAKLPAAQNHAAIRALFLKYSDRLDWNGAYQLLSRLAPSEDGSRQQVYDELAAAFLRERGSELSAVEAARIAATISSAGSPSRADARAAEGLPSARR